MLKSLDVKESTVTSRSEMNRSRHSVGGFLMCPGLAGQGNWLHTFGREATLAISNSTSPPTPNTYLVYGD